MEKEEEKNDRGILRRRERRGSERVKPTGNERGGGGKGITPL